MMLYYLFMVQLVLLLLTKDTLTFVEIKMMKVMQLGNWIIIAASTDKTSSQYRMLMVDTGPGSLGTLRDGVFKMTCVADKIVKCRV